MPENQNLVIILLHKMAAQTQSRLEYHIYYWLPFIECTQCMWFSTFIKATAFHYSFFCYLDYLAQSLPVQKTDLALFEWHSCYQPSFLYSAPSASELLL